MFEAVGLFLRRSRESPAPLAIINFAKVLSLAMFNLTLKRKLFCVLVLCGLRVCYKTLKLN